MLMPSASATVSCARIARQARPLRARSEIDAQEQRRRRRGQKDKVPGAAVGDGDAAERGRIDDDAGGETAPRFVFAAEIDHHEVQRQRADREVEPAQAQRRQSEDDPEQCSDQGGRRQRDPERRIGFPEQNSDRERARRHQAGVPERNLAGIAGQQHQRERADAGEKYLAGEIELERRRHERERQQRQDEHAETGAFEPGSDQREVLRVAGAEVAAGARCPRHGRVPRGCRTAPRAARSAWR